jgi:flagellin-like hook-associated protein FlgL
VAGSIVINSNLAALSAQRRLGQNTQALQQSFTRLASGLRINKASDDAAGLAISESLNVDARVFAQGLRNLNDGISLTNIAEGALQELTNITIRQRELTTQAANGTLSLRQRQALNQEANALVDEFNRITSSTDFNGIALLDCSLSELRVQAGYGSAGSVSFAISQSLSRTVGAGTLSAATSFASGTDPLSLALGDLNADGVLDMVTADQASNCVSVSLGNGDGTFKARTSFAAGSGSQSVALGDLNGDGAIDLAVADTVAFVAFVFIGNGNGTFKAKSSFASHGIPNTMKLGDLNGDGTLDMATANGIDGTVGVYIGNGDGTFKVSDDLAATGRTRCLTMGDFNADGFLDLLSADNTSKASVFLGNGNGTFKANMSFASCGMDSLSVGDLNGDGILDVVSSSASVLIGNADGTFKASTFYAPSASYVTLGDLNGDGVLDIATADSTNTTSILIGNGDGSFKAKTSYASGTGPSSLALGDLTGDGVLDLATSCTGSDAAFVFLSNTMGTTTTPHLNICSQQGAKEAMATIDATLARIASELGSIGSVQSRLAVAVNTLSVSRENYLSAKSQITDADVSEESARLVRTQILQQASAAVLAQANQAPALALMLLKGG